MATSKLQDYTGKQLRSVFRRYAIEENYRPDWLMSSNGGRLELDFFIDELSMAVEVQGAQHTQFIPYFHVREQAFLEQQQRDREKAEICQRAGIGLFYVYDRQDVSTLIADFRMELERQEEKRQQSFRVLASNADRFRHHLHKLCAFVANMEKGYSLNENSWGAFSESLKIVVIGINQCGMDIPGNPRRRNRKIELVNDAIELLAAREYKQLLRAAQ